MGDLGGIFKKVGAFWEGRDLRGDFIKKSKKKKNHGVFGESRGGKNFFFIFLYFPNAKKPIFGGIFGQRKIFFFFFSCLSEWVFSKNKL